MPSSSRFPAFSCVLLLTTSAAFIACSLPLSYQSHARSYPSCLPPFYTLSPFCILSTLLVDTCVLSCQEMMCADLIFVSSCSGGPPLLLLSASRHHPQVLSMPTHRNIDTLLHSSLPVHLNEHTHVAGIHVNCMRLPSAIRAAVPNFYI